MTSHIGILGLVRIRLGKGPFTLRDVSKPPCDRRHWTLDSLISFNNGLGGSIKINSGRGFKVVGREEEDGIGRRFCLEGS